MLTLKQGKLSFVGQKVIIQFKIAVLPHYYVLGQLIIITIPIIFSEN